MSAPVVDDAGAADVAALASTGLLPVCRWRLGAGVPRLTTANAAFRALAGLDEQEELPPWVTLLEEGSREAFATVVDDLRVEGRHLAQEIALVTRAGDVRPILFTSAVVAGDEVVSVCLDAAAPARARQDAERASQAKSRFLAVMTHELRTPLNTIHGQVALLREGVYGPQTEAQEKALERVERAEKQLRRVVDDVLTASRLEMGHVTYESRPVSIRAVIAEVAAAVASQCAAKRQTLTVAEVSEDLVAQADPVHVQHALLALVSNAVKFTPVEGCITLDTATRTEVPDYVFVRVTDTGVGIPESHFESIFAPFAQGDERRARTAEGLGLGLTLARDLVRGMGGDVRVRSQRGQGATFTIALRRADASDAPPRGD